MVRALPFRAGVVLLFLRSVYAFQVTFEDPSTTTAPVTATASWQRQSGDPTGITIRVVDISDPSGPQEIQSEPAPDSEGSGTFSVQLTTPGTYALQAGPGSTTIVDSNTITVLPGPDTDSSTSAQSHSTTTKTTSTTSSTSTTSTSLTSSSVITDPNLPQSSVAKIVQHSSSSTTTSADASTSTSSTSSTSRNILPPVSNSSSIPVTLPHSSSVRSTPSITTFPSTSTTISTTTIPAQPSNHISSSTSRKKGPIIGGILGGVIAFILLVLICFFIYRRRLGSNLSTWFNAATRHLSRRSGDVEGFAENKRRWYRINRDGSLNEHSSVLPFARQLTPSSQVGSPVEGTLISQLTSLYAGGPLMAPSHLDSLNGHLYPILDDANSREDDLIPLPAIPSSPPTSTTLLALGPDGEASNYPENNAGSEPLFSTTDTNNVHGAESSSRRSSPPPSFRASVGRPRVPSPPPSFTTSLFVNDRSRPTSSYYDSKSLQARKYGQQDVSSPHPTATSYDDPPPSYASNQEHSRSASQTI
ncbi:hypothetical protein GYMLUDRAFT_47447 [Collybiopsis luxurians FD-317 M1]|uniref:Mid2 domain-containing protein n=1 Tax=Collybiopsis luxurians FD-317 M1 TaxID=944289 RepID=A0A0D0CD55_9AGAR|nr:hypothetical protein GYMLUDRAFT_47447 [Collybiopsis luxurians FD-317 M1]